MNTTIKATNLKLTPAIKTYIQKKMDMTEKYLGKQGAIKCEFEIELTTKHHQKGEIFRAEVNLALPHALLRIERAETDLYRAIDNVKDHLVELIRKHKEKRVAQRRPAMKKDA